jgi:hypothetical protein
MDEHPEQALSDRSMRKSAGDKLSLGRVASAAAPKHQENNVALEF